MKNDDCDNASLLLQKEVAKRRLEMLGHVPSHEITARKEQREALGKLKLARGRPHASSENTATSDHKQVAGMLSRKEWKKRVGHLLGM